MRRRLPLHALALSLAALALASGEVAGDQPFFRLVGKAPLGSELDTSPALVGNSIPGTGSLDVAGPASIRGGSSQPISLQLARPANATGDVTWASVGTQLPAGLSLSPSGFLSGRGAPVTGVRFRATDAKGLTGTTDAFPILATQPTVTLSGAQPSMRLRVGDAPSIQAEAAGIAGRPAWNYVARSGALPDGLGFDPTTALLGGVVRGPGVATFSIGVTDGADKATGKSDVVAIASAPALALRGVKTAYAAHQGHDLVMDAPILDGAQETPAYALSVPTPAGMTFSEATGRLTGQPPPGLSLSGVGLTATDPWDNRTVTARFDLSSPPPVAFGTQPTSVTVNTGGTVSILPALANAVGSPTFALLKDGAVTPDALAACSGLGFSAVNGGITGSPLAECDVRGLSILAVDGDGTSVTSSGFSVTAQFVPTATLSLPSQVRTGGITGTVTTNLASPTFAFQSSPSGWSFTSANGILTAGAPNVTVATPYDLSVLVTGGGRSVRSPTARVTVNPPLSLSYQNLAFSTGQPVSQPAVIRGNVGSLTFALLRNGAPDATALDVCGVSLNPSTGALTSSAAKSCNVAGIGVRMTDAGANGLPQTTTDLLGQTVTSQLLTAANTCHRTNLYSSGGTLYYDSPVQVDYFRVNWTFSASSGGSSYVRTDGYPGGKLLGENIGTQGNGSGYGGYTGYGGGGVAYTSYQIQVITSGTYNVYEIIPYYGGVAGKKC